jgi:hypothetical protein
MPATFWFAAGVVTGIIVTAFLFFLVLQAAEELPDPDEPGKHLPEVIEK